MYFMPRTNRLCRLFAPVPSIYRYAATALFLMFIGAVWYCGIYCRIAQTMATRSQAMTHSFAQHKNGSLVQSEPALISSLEQADRAVGDYNKEWQRSGIELILGGITKSGLRFVSSDITTKKNAPTDTKAEQPYVQDSIALHMVGALKQCSQFFSLMSASGVDFACQQIDIVATDHNLYAMSCVINVVTTQGANI